jgi:hypothetical protein
MKDSNIITPAEKPRVKAIKRAPGFLTKTAKKLPMVVDNPASALSTNAMATLPAMNRLLRKSLWG